MNTLLNLFQVNSWIFPLLHFYSIPGQKFEMKEIFVKT